MTVLANRFSNPFPQFQDATGAARNGGTLTFYLTGTTTISAPYTDSAHTVAAGTAGVVTLNSLGSATTDIFLDPAVTYKIVLKDADGNVIWTADPYYDPLLQQQAKFAVYAGDPNGNVAGTAGTPGGTPADVIFDTSNLIIWVCTTTGIAAAAVWTSTTGQLAGSITFTGVISPTAIATDQDNYNPTGLASASEIRLNVTGDCLLTGLAGGSAGRVITLVNIGTNRVTLMNLSGSSTAGNTFRFGHDFYLDPDDSLMLKYDAVTGKWRRFSGVHASAIFIGPQGRLTLTSATPVLAADVSAATAVYLTPYNGRMVPIWDGYSFVMLPFTELTLTLAAQHLANSLYDIFAYKTSAGLAALATGPAWTVAGNYVSAGTLTTGTAARGTGAATTQLTRTAYGLYTNTVSMTGRNGATTPTIAAGYGTYLGTLWTDATVGQTTCHVAYGQNRKWGLWNAYNRVPIVLLAGDTTASWTYNSATVRAARGQTDNSLTVLCGLPEENVDAAYASNCSSVSQNAAQVFIGVGLNSITAISGQRGSMTGNATVNVGGSMRGDYFPVPFIGLNAFSALEASNAASNSTFLGGNDDMQLSALWRG